MGNPADIHEVTSRLRWVAENDRDPAELDVTVEARFDERTEDLERESVSGYRLLDSEDGATIVWCEASVREELIDEQELEPVLVGPWDANRDVWMYEDRYFIASRDAFGGSHDRVRLAVETAADMSDAPITGPHIGSPDGRRFRATFECQGSVAVDRVSAIPARGDHELVIELRNTSKSRRDLEVIALARTEDGVVAQHGSDRIRDVPGQGRAIATIAMKIDLSALSFDVIARART